VIVAFVSSRMPLDPQPSDLTVDAMHPGFASTGLRVTSTVRLHRLMTLAIPMLRRELGVLPPDLLNAVSSRLKALFSLA
jgi:mRNA interferase MazF